MTRLDNIFNIADAKNFSWWEEDVKDLQPDAVDNGNEGKDVDSDKKDVKDPQPETDDSTNKGDGKEGVKDPQPETDDSTDKGNGKEDLGDCIEIDEGFHQSSYHSSMDYYPEDSDWLI